MYQVEGGTSLEPLDLAFVEGVSKLDLLRGAVLVLNDEGEVFARSKALQTLDVNLVGTLDTVVVGRVDEGERKHTLLLQVGLVNTGEGADDDGKTTEETGLKSSMLTGRTFTVVVVTDDDPLDAGVAVFSSDLRNTTPGSINLALDLVGLAVLSVDSTDEAIL